MLYKESHPSDQDLVMAADGELPARRAAAVREHLASCWPCRARMQRIDAAILDFVHLHHSEFASNFPPGGGPRARLRVRLSALAAESESRSGLGIFGLFATRGAFPLACAALLGVLTLALAAGLGSFLSRGGSRLARLEVAVVPRPQLTPGATVPVSKQQVCGSVASTQGPRVPASLQQRVFQAYGITNPRPGAYEIDYLITPDLGGAPNIRNLWPQPYYNTAWTAEVKDQLEERLHSMVCRGDLDLATAQHDLAADWISAYKKYFHTDRPRLEHPKAGNPPQHDLALGFSLARGPWQLTAFGAPCWHSRLSQGDARRHPRLAGALTRSRLARGRLVQT